MTHSCNCTIKNAWAFAVRTLWGEKGVFQSFQEISFILCSLNYVLLSLIFSVLCLLLACL